MRAGRLAWLRMDRARWRTVLLCLGVVPALAALGFAALVLRVIAVQHAGDNAYQDGRYLDAAQRYRSAGHLNPFEDWLAAFDAGAARHTAGQYPAAVQAYQAALALGVPHRDACTVRINLSLADEAIGDQAGDAHRLNDADDAYRDGIAVLEAGHCPTDSGRGADQSKAAKAVEDRLRQKLQHNQKVRQRQQEQKRREQNKSPQQKQREQQRQQRQRQQEQQRQRRLDQQNRQGLKDRNRQQDLGGGTGSTPNW